MVTGASFGIGEAIAIEAASRGARVIGLARREGPLREAMDAIDVDAPKIVPADAQRLDELLVERAP